LESKIDGTRNHGGEKMDEDKGKMTIEKGVVNEMTFTMPGADGKDVTHI
jgi:hypothetical protein